MIRRSNICPNMCPVPDQELLPGQLLLFGGTDASGKPLNDGYVFETSTMTWTCLYRGASDLLPPMVGSAASPEEGGGGRVAMAACLTPAHAFQSSGLQPYLQSHMPSHMGPCCTGWYIGFRFEATPAVAYAVTLGA